MITITVMKQLLEKGAVVAGIVAITHFTNNQGYE
jgi:hypothetical protein